MAPGDDSGITAQIADTLKRAAEEQHIHGYGTSNLGRAFFRLWMKEEGNAYFFLFSKNLKVTNIQFAELFALVSSNVRNPKTGEQPKALQFVSYSDFTGAIQELLDSLPDPSSASRGPYSFIADLYGHLLDRTVVIDPRFGSCAVYLPPHLELDLAAVCGLSGYVHSCGRNIFVRNVDKANKRQFFEALRRYLKRYPAPHGKKLVFTPYAHEDFTGLDYEAQDELRDGLNEVKIYVQKLYMQEHLVDVLNELQTEFDTQLAIPRAGDYRIERELLRKRSDIDLDRTIWLISDHGINSSGLSQGDDRYFICFDQLYRNGNPFHIFDENKPGWIEHTTIPHRLMGAMINIARPYWPSTGAVVADPFVGAGTTRLELAKFSGVTAATGDISATAIRAAADNVEFFALPSEEIDEIAKTLQLLVDNIEHSGRGSCTDSDPHASGAKDENGHTRGKSARMVCGKCGRIRTSC